MPALPDVPFAAALLRMLASRARVEAAGVFAVEGASCRLLAGTASLFDLGESGGTGFMMPVPAALAVPGAARVDPAELGIESAFAAVARVETSGSAGPKGFVLIADRRLRRFTSAIATALDDAAALAKPLLAATPGPIRTFKGGSALRAAIRPRADALKVVGTAMRTRMATETAGLMVIDLDRFRAVNEALGVDAGDAVLAVTATRLGKELDARDRLLRIEGDRFIIVAFRDAAGMRILARRLLQAVNQPLTLGGRTVSVQASIGIVIDASSEQATPDLLVHAEAALRRAKAEGRARFVLHEPKQNAAHLETSRLELDLPGALASGEMQLAFQPYVDLQNGEISGAEALLRWQHPTRGELQPAAFVPLAETTGMIIPLGRWVLRTAMARAMRWPERLALAVNISPLQFRQPGFIAEVDEALHDTGFPPARLEFEITETVLMRDNPETTDQLQALIERGIRIALDDFGTGYSALAYLARLPHHRIKLDKCFVQDLGNPATAELIRAIITQARARGVAVTAEGVEHPRQLAMVRQAGFTHAQGFATGLPVVDPTPALFEDFAVPAR